MEGCIRDLQKTAGSGFGPTAASWPGMEAARTQARAADAALTAAEALRRASEAIRR